MKINKNSWHYKLFARTNVLSNLFKDWEKIQHYRRDRKMSLVQVHNQLYYDPVNFCQYWRRAIIKPATILAVNSVALMILTAIVIYNLTSVLVGAAMMTGIIAALFVIALIAFGTGKTIGYFAAKLHDTNTLLGTAVKVHKENICVGVDYE